VTDVPAPDGPTFFSISPAPISPAPGRPLVTALIAAAVAGCLTLAGCGGSSGPEPHATPSTTGATGTSAASGSTTAGSTTPSPNSNSVGSWTTMTRSPLPQPWIASGVWDGDELLVVGIATGTTGSEYAVAAAYSPSADRWRRLTTPSIPSTQGGPQAVWTGNELFVWGGGFHHVYNPKAGTWRGLPGIDAGPQGGGFALVWTGHAILAWGGGCCGSARSTGAAYDPATNTWTALPTAPLRGRFCSGVWTGSELLIAGGNDADGKVFDDAAAYNPTTRHWRTLARMPDARAAATLTWTGSEALMAGAWTALPTSPLRGRGEPVAVWTGRQLLVWGGADANDGARYTP
jgi:Galactose oxidase, central domain